MSVLLVEVDEGNDEGVCDNVLNMEKIITNIVNLISKHNSKNLQMYQVSGFIILWTEDSDFDDEVKSNQVSVYVQLACICHLNQLIFLIVAFLITDLSKIYHIDRCSGGTI
jgi:hypothetical protein